MLLGIIKKDSGEITWKGKEVDRKHVRFGYLPEERGVYPKTKIFDQLMYFAELKGMNKVDAIKPINKWAKELKVEEYMQMPAEKLSKGNQQKIQFMTAIIHDPKELIESKNTSEINVKINVYELLGSEVYLYFDVEKFPVTARVNADTTARTGDMAKFIVDMEKAHVFDKETGLVITN